MWKQSEASASELADIDETMKQMDSKEYFKHWPMAAVTLGKKCGIEKKDAAWRMENNHLRSICIPEVCTRSQPQSQEYTVSTSHSNAGIVFTPNTGLWFNLYVYAYKE